MLNLKNKRIGAAVVVPAFVATAASCTVVDPACKDWNTDAFFERANATDISYCVNAGANVNAEDKYGWTPLHGAAVYSDPAVVAALVEAGADVNAEGEDGWTPLLVAAVYSDPAGVAALVDRKSVV